MRIPLDGVERDLAAMALDELVAAKQQMEQRFALRVQNIRKAHGVADGVKAEFGAESGVIYMDVPDQKAGE